MASTTRFIRRPYTGSCHCGHIKYIVWLSLPQLPYPQTTQTDFRNGSGHRLYRCNCTICHKASLLHFRLLDPANDFVVVSPTNLLEEGSGFKSYIPDGCTGSWNFCETCGVRAFSLRGTGYTDEVQLPTALLQRLHSRTLNGTTGEITAKDGETTRVSVWRPRKDWHELRDEDGDVTDPEYLSINASTIDANGFDLRQLQEKGYVAYMQTLEWVGYDYQDTPYFGGMY